MEVRIRYGSECCKYCNSAANRGLGIVDSAVSIVVSGIATVVSVNYGLWLVFLLLQMQPVLYVRHALRAVPARHK